MEARALAQFSPPDGRLSSLRRSSSATVPELLYHSLEEHVLVLEDLGPLLTLYQYFSAMADDKYDGPMPGQEACRRLGSRIGEFFSQLHSPDSRELVRTATCGDLENPLVKDLILQAAVMTVEQHLTRFNIADAQMLFSRVLADNQRVNMPAEQCFVLGDFTPGAVLLAASGDGSQPMGIIDWEFSGLGRGPNGDMSQFLAIVHLLLMAASPGSQRHGALDSLIRGICLAYHQNSSKWLGQLYLRAPNISNSAQSEIQARLENLQIFRSALILHGHEMINNAVEQEWHDSPGKKGSVLVREMVQNGAWYLDRAGNDIGGMLNAANLEELLKEDSRVMLGLFGIEH
jgi:hypothetical protein